MAKVKNGQSVRNTGLNTQVAQVSQNGGVPKADNDLLMALMQKRQEAYEASQQNRRILPDPGTEGIVEGIDFRIGTFKDQATGQEELYFAPKGRIVALYEGDESLIGQEIDCGFYTSHESRMWVTLKYCFGRILDKLTGNLALDAQAAAKRWTSSWWKFTVEEDRGYSRVLIDREATADEVPNDEVVEEGQ